MIGSLEPILGYRRTAAALYDPVGHPGLGLRTLNGRSPQTIDTPAVMWALFSRCTLHDQRCTALELRTTRYRNRGCDARDIPKIIRFIFGILPQTGDNQPQNRPLTPILNQR